MPPPGEQRFEVGRALGRVFGVLGRNAAVVFIIALLLAAAPLAGVGWLNRMLGPSKDAVETLWRSFGLSLPVALFCEPLLTAALAYVTGEDLGGRRAGLLAPLRCGFGSIPLLWGVQIVRFLMIATASLLLILPGIFVGLSLTAAVPACAIEKKGLQGSMERSFRLTADNLWRLLLFQVCLTAILFAAVIPAAFALGFATALLHRSIPEATLFYGVTGGTFGRVILAAGAASAYFELRLVKDGTTERDVAEVFARLAGTESRVSCLALRQGAADGTHRDRESALASGARRSDGHGAADEWRRRHVSHAL